MSDRTPLAYVASNDSRNFHFEGHGRTETEALAALDRAYALHGRLYDLPDDWHVAADLHCDIKVRPIYAGASWRDGEELEGEEWRHTSP